MVIPICSASSPSAPPAGEAAEGNKTYIDTFDRLGVKLLNASGQLRPTEAVLRDVIGAISSIEDPARRAAFAADLFGRGARSRRRPG